MNSRKTFPIVVKERQRLSALTSFCIGGPAEFYIEPVNEKHLAVLLRQLSSSRLPVRLLGAGSNILASDGLLKGVVLCLRSQEFCRIAVRGRRIAAGAGAMLSRLLSAAADAGLSRAEFLTGIPGTVGGAVAMNAGISEGARTRSISDLIEKVRVMDYNGRIKVLGRRQLHFSYRSSGLEKFIILEVVLLLKRSSPASVRRAISAYAARRKNTQDYRYPSAGCIFKNPRSGDPAGKMIDLCGLKGLHMGGAAVSRSHANFIVNTGGARARDVLQLMGKLKRKVKERFGVLLEPEIKIWR